MRYKTCPNCGHKQKGGAFSCEECGLEFWVLRKHQLTPEDRKFYRIMASRISQRFKSSGLTLDQLASYCGCSDKQLRRYLASEKMPLHIFYKLCKKLALNPYHVLASPDAPSDIVNNFVSAALKLDAEGLSYMTGMINGYIAGTRAKNKTAKTGKTVTDADKQEISDALKQ